MFLNMFVFFIGQLTIFLKNRITNTYFTYIMQSCRFFNKCFVFTV